MRAEYEKGIEDACKYFEHLHLVTFMWKNKEEEINKTIEDIKKYSSDGTTHRGR